MKNFLKAIMLFSLPFWAVLAIYVAYDPFKVVWDYNDYYLEGHNYLAVNRGMVSAKTFARNNAKQRFDSFIFGNSRSLVYTWKMWRQYIPAGSSYYHFDFSHGSVRGLCQSIGYVDECGSPLRQALLIIDYDLLSYDDVDGFLFMNPPEIEHYRNVWKFQKEPFVAFTNSRFLRALIDYKLHGVYRKYMGDYIAKYHDSYDPVNNECTFRPQDVLIAKGQYYTGEVMENFKDMQHPGEVQPACIDASRAKQLEQLSRIFERHHTHYRIVINPTYDQKRINPADVAFLRRTFGAENVLDFTGVNRWNSDYHNFYDKYHYRPNVAAEILQIIYAKQ